MLEFSGALVLDAEAGAAGANIKTPGDALWWGYVTITTVGYGDQYPVTPWGRVIGVFLLTAGWRCSASSPASSPTRSWRRGAAGGCVALPAEPGSVQAELDAIRDLLAENEERNASLRSRLDALEGALVAVATPQALARARRRSRRLDSREHDLR